MKRNNKHWMRLSIAMSLMFSVSILPQAAQAHPKSPGQTSYIQEVKKTQQKPETKKFSVNGKTKSVPHILMTPNNNAITYPKRIHDDWITYPDYIAEFEVLPEILDEDEAYDYLFAVLGNLKKYNLKKHIIETEDPEDFPSASDVEEWYFSYGKEKKGEFIPSKYFAVNEDGEIFEYNAEKDAWFILVMPYTK